MSGWNLISYLNSALKSQPVSPGTPLPATLYNSGGTAVAWGFTPVEITTKTTTLVKSGAGMIGSITINTVGSADTITVYDALSATGTPIATIASPTLGQKYCEGYLFAVGCCVVTGGTTAGKYTVAYA